jgi:hypothetical protein
VDMLAPERVGFATPRSQPHVHFYSTYTRICRMNPKSDCCCGCYCVCPGCDLIALTIAKNQTLVCMVPPDDDAGVVDFAKGEQQMPEVLTIGAVVQTIAERRGVDIPPRKLSDLIYRRKPNANRCPVVGGVRRIPADYPPVIWAALEARGVLQQEQGVSHA